jgi:glyoxylase-like metal-dependent hydrolase (beta-lactamase superfamily II)
LKSPKEDPLLHQIKLPVPIAGVDSVFCYLLKDGRDVILIDTGWNTDDSYAVLKENLQKYETQAEAITQIVITHLHPDHFGLAGVLKQKSKAVVCMHRKDTDLIKERYEEYKELLDILHAWLRLHGTPKAELERMLRASLPMLKFVQPIFPDILLDGSEEIKTSHRTLRVISTPGHTPGNICLYIPETKVLVSGDHVLPGITPNVSLNPQYKGSPLHDYLNSLRKLKKLEVDAVFPAHEHAFSNLPKRIEEIEKHHKERLDETLNVLATDEETAYEVAKKLTWYSGGWDMLSPWERRAALMETLAHLEYLKRERRLVEKRNEKDGLMTYKRADEVT